MTSCVLIEASLADRIEQAYRLRYPYWRDGCQSERVWSVAAAVLIEIHQKDGSNPVDPELFVAVQPLTSHWADPWAELAGRDAARNYRRQVRRMILSLRREIRREVRRAELKVRRGAQVEAVLLPSNYSLTALGCFIVAQRAGRLDLACQFRQLAVEQHSACPLYRQACLGLLPRDVYPDDAEKLREPFSFIPLSLRGVQASLN